MPSLNIAADVQAKILKTLAGLFIVGSVLFAVYMQGRSDGKAACQGAVQRQVIALAERKANNAVDATTRLGDFLRNDRALEVGIADALAQVRDYYQNQKPNAKTIRVKVPGKTEYVYVPTDACPSNGLNADELRLYNLGNKRSDLNLGDSKGVSETVPEGTAGR